MEKKVGKNVSSGAEKVETVEREKKISAEEVDAAPAKKPVKKSRGAKKPSSKQQRAEKKERAAAKGRLEKAKAKKEQKNKEKAEKREKKLALKEKKLEKKAALKEKKAERKALAAQKKAERKQKKLEKKAALKEKKLERRAEKVARREMLKNETKTEKQKRIAREKREHLALKRKKQEEKAAAHAKKQEAKEAAHVRRAEDKRHKREQRTARKENRRGFGGWLAAVISLGVACLALATVVTAGAFRMNDMTVEAEGSARATLYEMVSLAEDMDGNLSKLRVSAGVDEQRKLLTELVAETAVMESALERMPVDAVTGTSISAYLNRAGEYARQLLSRLASGKTITAEQRDVLERLYATNAAMHSELNDLATHMTESDLKNFLAGGTEGMLERFGKAGEGLKEGFEEIADNPFFGRGNVGENKLASLGEISEQEAEEKAAEYFSGYHVRDIRSAGETEAPDFTCYNLILTDENDLEIFAQITKNGGKLAFFDTYEDCTDKNFDLDTCDAIAREYLGALGIDNVEPVWLSDGGMTANLTYVAVEDGVRLYPEILRVRVCESKGRVIGIDARGYLLNHEERSLHAALSEREARELLFEGLEVTGADLALIPTAEGEKLCYEFAGRYGEDEYLIYLDATTGMETEMYRVCPSARGSYLD